MLTAKAFLDSTKLGRATIKNAQVSPITKKNSEEVIGFAVNPVVFSKFPNNPVRLTIWSSTITLSEDYTGNLQIDGLTIGSIWRGSVQFVASEVHEVHDD